MEAKPALAELLQWYVQMGADEAMGTVPVDRTQSPAVIPEKAIILPIASAPIIAEIAPVVPGTIEALGDAKLLAARAQTIEDLKVALENFQGLSLKRTATQMVFADGLPTAKIMLVGEAPGADEDRAGRSFLGEQGQLLDKMLGAIGLSRENNVYLTTVINWRPPGNRAASEAEIALSLPFVQRHIELINPAVLIYVGGIPAKALLQTTQGIGRLRGKWMDYISEGLKQPIPSLAMLSPAYLIESPAQKAQAWADLQMLKAKLQEMAVL